MDYLYGGPGDDILDCFDNPNVNADTAQGQDGDDDFYVDDIDGTDWVTPEGFAVKSYPDPNDPTGGTPYQIPGHP